jgi:glycosyltransferase involved in cell wall biosynthesis
VIKLLHVTEDHTKANPGVTEALLSYTRQVLPRLGQGERIEICATTDGTALIESPVPVIAVPYWRVGRGWRWSPAIEPVLAARVRDGHANLLHAHGIWLAAQVAAARVAKRLGVPMILTNHGALTTWALAQPSQLGAWKKRLYLKLVADRSFRSVTVLHAITLEDRDILHARFPGQRVELIPNSTDVESIVASCGEATAQASDYILFIGRLHPKKGVHLLVDAFLASDLPRRYRLVVAGPPQVPGYVAAIERSIRASKYAERVEMIGPVWGAAKYRLMQQAHVAVVPSFSEVVGLVNLEAAACGTPTITTRETGLLDWAEGGGMLVAPNGQDVARALETAAAWSDSERRDRGVAMRELVRRRYSTTATAPLWHSLYSELAK